MQKNEKFYEVITLSEYSPEINKMVFSFSRCHSFENCKYEWYLNYLLRDEDGNRIYENEQNFYAAFGKFCHEILESILKGEMTEQDGFEYYKEHFEEVTSEFDASDSTLDKYYFFGFDYFSQLSFSWLQEYDILGIEKECRFDINGIQFLGYIDLLIRHKETGDIIVIDHKSGEYPIGKKGQVLKRKIEDYEAYKKQMYLYSKQVYKEYGVYPKKIVWNYFRDSQWLDLPFDYQEYIATQEWVKNIVSTIHKEEDFAPKLDYFYCANICGFRNSCEYKTMGDE